MPIDIKYLLKAIRLGWLFFLKFLE